MHYLPCLQYNVTVVGTLPDGTKTPVSNTLSFTTPLAGYVTPGLSSMPGCSAWPENDRAGQCRLLAGMG